MTEPRRSAWSAFADEWDDDHPAVRLGREGRNLAPIAEPEPVPPTPRPDPSPDPAPPEPVAAPRPNRVAELIARVRDGDLSAVDILRRLLDG